MSKQKETLVNRNGVVKTLGEWQKTEESIIESPTQEITQPIEEPIVEPIIEPELDSELQGKKKKK